MLVATILPQKYLHLIKDDSYHMCLGHLMADTSGELDTYQEFYNDHSYGKFIIMDNGVIEDNRITNEQMYEMYETYKPDEIVLPDEFNNPLETLRLVDKACNFWANKNEIPQLMAVPHGTSSIEEWVDCAKIISRYPMIDTIGIPKVLVHNFGRSGRLNALRQLAESNWCEKNIHLLGCWTNTLEIAEIAAAEIREETPVIRGVDSTIPYVYARAGISMNGDDRPDKEPVNFVHGTIGDYEKLVHNVTLWKDAAELYPHELSWE